MHLYLRPSMVSLNLVFEDTDKWNFSFSSSCEMPQIEILNSHTDLTAWLQAKVKQMLEHSVLGK